MKITCERCRAQYDIDDAKIPASGFRMTCPACQNEMTISAGAASPPVSTGPREIALSSLDDEPAADLSKPVAALTAKPPASPAAKPLAAPSAPASSAIAEPQLADLDFSSVPAPPVASPAAPVREIALADDGVDLPSPVRAKAAPPPLRPPGKTTAPTPDEVDLPAPKTRVEPPRGGVDAGPDLPAPKANPTSRPPVPSAARPPVPTSVRPAPPPTPAPPASAGSPDLADLPQPRSAATGSVDLPTPKKAPALSFAGPPSVDEGDGAIPLDLDAPDVDDQLGDPELGDELTPRVDGSVDLPTPRPDGSVDLPTPRPDGTADGVAPRGPSPSRQASEDPRAPAPTPTEGELEPDDEEEEEADRARRGKKRTIGFAIAGVALIGAVGGVALALGLVGGGATNKRELASKLVSAHKALADDTLASFKRAAAELKPYSGGEHANEDAAALEAQARFSMVRLGVAIELAPGKALLEEPSKTTPSAERRRAEALRALASDDVAAAKKALKDLLVATPLDASALSYLGSAELASHDLGAAATFARALSAEPTRAQAAYGLGLAKEREGDTKAARDAYTKVIAIVPDHVRGKLGLLRIDARAGDGTVAGKLEALLTEQAATMAPREIAEARAALASVLFDAGRFDDAEEQFKKALALDPNPALSHVAFDARLGISRVRIALGRSGETIDDLRKLIGIDLHSTDARLSLAEALIDKQDGKEAESFLAATEKFTPKDPHIPFLRGRSFLARPSVSNEDREHALEKFREATTLDPKFLPALAATARTLHDLDRTSDALEMLDKAAPTLTSDPRGAAMLGATYLAIGKPAEAEARFRAVLAQNIAQPGATSSLPVVVGLGEALEAQGKLDAAEQVYADAQKTAPKSAMLLERRARLANRRGKLDDAGKLFADAMQIGTPSASLRLAAADLAFRTDHAAEARKLAESVVKDDDRSAVGTLLLAKIELGAGHVDEALGLARRAATLQDLPEAHLVLARVLEEESKLEGAAAEFSLAKRAPTLEPATLGRARILTRMGATRDALVELATLPRSGPLRAEALVLEGDCYTDLQQADKARHAYEDAVKLAPQLGDASFKLGRAFLDSGKRRPGIDALERAIKAASPKSAWIADAYMLLGDAHRTGHENDAALKAYAKYLEVAPATAPARAEASRQISLLGGTPAP